MAVPARPPSPFRGRRVAAAAGAAVRWRLCALAGSVLATVGGRRARGRRRRAGQPAPGSRSEVGRPPPVGRARGADPGTGSGSCTTSTGPGRARSPPATRRRWPRSTCVARRCCPRPRRARRLRPSRADRAGCAAPAARRAGPRGLGRARRAAGGRPAAGGRCVGRQRRRRLDRCRATTRPCTGSCCTARRRGGGSPRSPRCPADRRRSAAERGAQDAVRRPAAPSVKPLASRATGSTRSDPAPRSDSSPRTSRTGSGGHRQQGRPVQDLAHRGGELRVGHRLAGRPGCAARRRWVLGQVEHGRHPVVAADRGEPLPPEPIRPPSPSRNGICSSRSAPPPRSSTTPVRMVTTRLPGLGGRLGGVLPRPHHAGEEGVAAAGLLGEHLVAAVTRKRRCRRR